jgi:hypothetical protein
MTHRQPVDARAVGSRQQDRSGGEMTAGDSGPAVREPVADTSGPIDERMLCDPAAGRIDLLDLVLRAWI